MTRVILPDEWCQLSNHPIAHRRRDLIRIRGHERIEGGERAQAEDTVGLGWGKREVGRGKTIYR